MTEIQNQTDRNIFKSLASGTARVCLDIISFIKNVLLLIFYGIKLVICELFHMELLFMKMDAVYGFICQLLFCTICEMALMDFPRNNAPPHRELVGVSVLLFYNIFGYFIGRIIDIFVDSRPGRPTRTLHYATCVAQIVLEWMKVIAIVFCVKEKGILFTLEPIYTLTTFTYYICTEKIFVNLIINITGYLNLQFLDSMEHLYIPIILNIYLILSAHIITGMIIRGPYYPYALCAAYFILYLRIKYLYYYCIKTLMLEKETYASFRNASDNDIQKWDDICAVCLNRMSRAKITPCNHLFHPVCLKQCLRNSLQCPLCKYNFIQ